MKEYKVDIINDEQIANMIRDGVTYSHQTKSVVIHGAIESIRKAHYKALEQSDEQFNRLVEVCNELCDAAAGHDLGKMNEWVDKYANKDFTINWRKILNLK